VLLHFTRDEAKIVIQKAYAALLAGGRFAFSLKQGDGEEWSDAKLGSPRYFCYWTRDAIQPVLEDAGFTNIHIAAHSATVGSKAEWLHIIALKS
jgi:hypothetical protein